jgi:hypothetical protein
MVEGKKRGRKAKNAVQNDQNNQNNQNDVIDDELCQTSKPQKRTRTRTKTKPETEPNTESTNTTVENTVENAIETKPPVTRKRGRKPKGGKIIECPNVNDNTVVTLPNVIIHFKCKLSDLSKYLKNSHKEQTNTWDKQIGNYTEITNDTNKKSSSKTDNGNKTQRQKQQNMNENEIVPTSIYSGKSNELNYTFVNKDNDILNPNVEPNKVEELFKGKETDNNYTNTNTNTNTNNQNQNVVHKQQTNIDSNTSNPNDPEVLMKIHEMEVQFHSNNLNGKRSSCFWDTCAFDTPAFYIPKSMDMNNVRPYGCFCSLNCALSYLQNEEIDASSKFERRQLLFNLYSNVVKDKTFIKPAPDPRYTLDKFYGNLSIQQWRSLLTSDRMLLIVDKPLTPELPELHTETTDRFMSMGCMNTADPAQYGKFKIRKVAQKQSKTAIVAEKFGITTKA